MGLYTLSLCLRCTKQHERNRSGKYSTHRWNIEVFCKKIKEINNFRNIKSLVQTPFIMVKKRNGVGTVCSVLIKHLHPQRKYRSFPKWDQSRLAGGICCAVKGEEGFKLKVHLVLHHGVWTVSGNNNLCFLLLY